jgi:hypothetical protein
VTTRACWARTACRKSWPSDGWDFPMTIGRGSKIIVSTIDELLSYLKEAALGYRHPPSVWRPPGHCR